MCPENKILQWDFDDTTKKNKKKIELILKRLSRMRKNNLKKNLAV